VNLLPHLPFWAELLVFVASAVTIWVAGIFLSNNTDVLADRLHLGQALGGLILLAVATNLPEIAITYSAAASGQLDVAVSNILGGIAIQTVVLVALDAFGVRQRRPLTYQAASLTLSSRARSSLPSWSRRVDRTTRQGLARRRRGRRSRSGPPSRPRSSSTASTPTRWARSCDSSPCAACDAARPNLAAVGQSAPGSSSGQDPQSRRSRWPCHTALRERRLTAEGHSVRPATTAGQRRRTAGGLLAGPPGLLG